MKWSLFALCLLFAVFCPLTVNAVSINANQKNGVTSISEDVIKELRLSDGDVVYKLYNCPVINAFGNATSIEEVLTGEDILQTVYAVQKDNYSANQWNFYIQEKNTLNETFDNTMSNISRELQILLDNSRIIGKIGETTKYQRKILFLQFYYESGNSNIL